MIGEERLKISIVSVCRSLTARLCQVFFLWNVVCAETVAGADVADGLLVGLLLLLYQGYCRSSSYRRCCLWRHWHWWSPR
uniref:Putative secreted protein n=1 Tax=Anopheles triannulatus TaxID=58253 RepID=A0A2M4B110_9DIPT